MNSLLFMGAAIGFGLSAIISIFTNRYRLMLAVGLFSLTIISFILIFIDISRSTFMILYFILGVMSGTETLVFAIGRFLSPKGPSGSATAGINLINNMIPVILLPMIWHILIKYGHLISDSSYTYTIKSYQSALTIIIAILIINIPLVALLPKHTKL